MKPISSPWALVRHMWVRNFQQNPIGTVLGSVLAIGGVGLLVFFGFFVFLALFVMGGLLLLANALFGSAQGTATRPNAGSDPFGPGPVKSSENKALEGEYTVVPDDENKAGR